MATQYSSSHPVLWSALIGLAGPCTDNSPWTLSLPMVAKQTEGLNWTKWKLGTSISHTHNLHTHNHGFSNKILILTWDTRNRRTKSCKENKNLPLTWESSASNVQGLVVQRIDSTIHQINYWPVSNLNIHLVESIVLLPSEQPGLELCTS